MTRAPRGRPPLNLSLESILRAVWHHRKIVAAARQLHCSDAYIHVRIRRAGLSLWDILNAEDVESLLERPHNQ